MNFSIHNNSLSRRVIVSQRLFESTGRLPLIDMYFLQRQSAKINSFR